MSIFQPPPHFFHPPLPFPPDSPNSASPLLPRRRRSPLRQEAAPALGSTSSSLSSPLFPAALATTLIVLCLTAAVLLSLINQQCDDMTLFTTPGMPDSTRDDPSVITLTVEVDTLIDRKDSHWAGRRSRDGEELHERDHSDRRDREHMHEANHQHRDGPALLLPPPSSSSSPPSSWSSSTGEDVGTRAAAAVVKKEDCVGICCMSFLSRILLILAFFCNAILISLLLCVRQPQQSGEQDGQQPQQQSQQDGRFPVFFSSTSFQRCVAYLVLAVVHFVLTGAVTLLLLNQQSHVHNLPSFHSSLLFSSYILLMFTSFCIEALCLLSAIGTPYTPSPSSSTSSASSFSSFTFLPPDPDTERLLFHSLPTDPTQSLSSTAFAFLPSHIVQCVGNAQCMCQLQKMDEGHVCKEMEEGRRRRRRKGKAKREERRAVVSSRSEERVEEGEGGDEERVETRKKREEEATVASSHSAGRAAPREEEEEDEEEEEEEDEAAVAEVGDSDAEEWELERGRVETFDFERGLVVSSSVPSYSPRYGSLSSSLALLPSPPAIGGEGGSRGGLERDIFSSSLPNLPVLSQLSPQSSSRSLHLSPSASFSSSPSLFPSSALTPLPSLASSCSCVCAICLCRFHAHSIIKLIACHHRFHLSCLRPWAARRTTCPLCRAPLTGRVEGDDRRLGRGQGRSVSFSG